MIKTIRNPVSCAIKAALAVSVGTWSVFTFAWEAPVSITEDDDEICWESSAPSTNIYEDGVYLATVHNQDCYGPVYEQSVYRLSAHDHGLNNDFSALSVPYLVQDDDDDDEDEDEDEELEFEESLLYFELNNTDGDLGIHGKVDGDEWRKVTLEDPNGRSLIDIKNKGGVAIQGLTELFFESAEPTFDELDPSEFFARFPQGTYEWSGTTIDGEEIEGEAELSHKIPAAPTVYVNGTMLEGCDEAPAISADTDGTYTVSWDEVESRHPTLGENPGVMDVEVDIYQFVLEREEQNVGGEEIPELTITIDFGADITSFTVPAALVGSGQEIKNEILVASEEGNQSATEFCWTAN